MSLPAMGFSPLGVDFVPSVTTTLVGSITDKPLIARILAENCIKYILHAAGVHKPHLNTHSKEDFVNVNMLGTMTVLEEAAQSGSIESFVFFSTTSTFGAALYPPPGSPAAWINEDVMPVPKNIYGATKRAAEDLCRLAHVEHGLAVVVLRVSRFFPEEDDDPSRAIMNSDNLQLLELAHRRCDIADVVSAAVCAVRQAPNLGWACLIISAPSPFPHDENTLSMLDRDPSEAFRCAVPGLDEVLLQRGWSYLDRIDRVLQLIPCNGQTWMATPVYASVGRGKPHAWRKLAE